MVHLRTALLILLPYCSSFLLTPPAAFGVNERSRSLASTKTPEEVDQEITALLDEETKGYSAGTADTPFAKRFGSSTTSEVPTVSDAMAKFTSEVGFPVSPIFRNQISDLVAIMHLTVVDVRFKYDAVWALGFTKVTDSILNSYPDAGGGEKISAALAASANLNIADIRTDAASITSWLAGKSEADVLAALKGEGGSEFAAIAAAAKGDDYWFYTKFFGIGLIQAMEEINVDPTADVMTSWLEGAMGKTPTRAISDLSAWNNLMKKLSQMTNLMKEIEIREKKKLAERLEDKAKAAVKRAEYDRIEKIASDKEAVEMKADKEKEAAAAAAKKAE